MSFIYWAIKRHLAHKRATASAMREMRRNDYLAGWHDQITKRTDWNRF